MKLNKLIYNIKNLLAGGMQTDDIALSDRQYIFIIDYYRYKLAKQRYEKSRDNIHAFLQELDRIELESLDEPDNVPIEFARRSKLTIPTPMVFDDGPHLIVNSLGSEEHFPLIGKNSARLRKHGKYAKDFGACILLSNYLYVKTPGTEGAKYLYATGLFESPLDVLRYNGVEIDEYTYDIEYPFPANLAETLYKMITSSEIKITEILPKDNTNDSKEERLK